MDKVFWRRTIWEVTKATVAIVAFSLFSLAITAACIRSLAPKQVVLTAINWIIKSAGAFAFSAIFIRGGRAAFKGMAAGLISVLLTMLLFALIGGGFHLDALFLVELVLCALLGGFGALIGAKLRKE